MSRNVLYIAVMALVSYTIRVLPLTLIPQTDPQHIYPVVSLLCALCYARCDDLSSPSCTQRSRRFPVQLP